MSLLVSTGNIVGLVQNVGWFVVVFSILVFIHELGHFLVAKWSGVRVHEFALGFGPALIKKRVGETLYAFRIIPLGGFVKMAGMEPTEEMREDPDDSGIEDDERAFHRQPVLNRLAIIAAGPIMNLALAILIYAVVVSNLVVIVGNVVPDSPAEQAGLQAHDRLVSVGGQRVLSIEHVLIGIQEAKGAPVTFLVDRDGKRESIPVQPEVDITTGIPMVGIELTTGVGTVRRPVGESLTAGVEQTWLATTELVRTLGRMIAGQEKPQLAGPIGIFQLTGTFADLGIIPLLSFMAMLSVTLGVFNLLPIPILDGGAILFLLIEWIRGRPLNPEHKGLAQVVGLSLLLLLMLFATLQDVTRLRSGESQTSMRIESGYEFASKPEAMHDPNHTMQQRWHITS